MEGRWKIWIVVAILGMLAMPIMPKTTTGTAVKEDVDETKPVYSPWLVASPGRHEVRVEVQPPTGYIDPNPSNNIDEGYFWFLS